MFTVWLKPYCDSFERTTYRLLYYLQNCEKAYIWSFYSHTKWVSRFLWLFIEPPTRGKSRQGHSPTKEKKSGAYVSRGSPPFLIESRLEAYILSSIGAVGSVSAAKRVETATGERRKGRKKGLFGEWARFESSGDCLPTWILKSRIFKKHPAARFSPLTRLRSLDTSMHLYINILYMHIYIHTYTYIYRYIYIWLCVYFYLVYISINILNYTGSFTEKFYHLSSSFFYSWKNCSLYVCTFHRHSFLLR